MTGSLVQVRRGCHLPYDDLPREILHLCTKGRASGPFFIPPLSRPACRIPHGPTMQDFVGPSLHWDGSRDQCSSPVGTFLFSEVSFMPAASAMVSASAAKSFWM